MANKFVALIFLLCFTGCVHSTITLFQSPSGDRTHDYPPTRPEDVAIYRSTNPFPSFTELGMISYRADYSDLSILYDQIRKDAAQFGAQAVVGVKLTGESHQETKSEEKCTPHTNCNAEGICTTENECHQEEKTVDVSTFLITGSMIRGKP